TTTGLTRLPILGARDCAVAVAGAPAAIPAAAVETTKSLRLILLLIRFPGSGIRRPILSDAAARVHRGDQAWPASPRSARRQWAAATLSSLFMRTGFMSRAATSGSD